MDWIRLLRWKRRLRYHWIAPIRQKWRIINHIPCLTRNEVTHSALNRHSILTFSSIQFVKKIISSVLIEFSDRYVNSLSLHLHLSHWKSSTYQNEHTPNDFVVEKAQIVSFAIKNGKKSDSEYSNNGKSPIICRTDNLNLNRCPMEASQLRQWTERYLLESQYGLGPILSFVQQKIPI